MAQKKQTKKPVKKTAPKTKAKKPVKKVEVKAQEATPAPVVQNIGIEQNASGAPKNFVIRCNKCCWSRVSSGISVDLADLHEIKGNCPTCGKARKFQCPKCGLPAFMKRIKGNT